MDNPAAKWAERIGEAMNGSMNNIKTHQDRCALALIEICGEIQPNDAKNFVKACMRLSAAFTQFERSLACLDVDCINDTTRALKTALGAFWLDYCNICLQSQGHLAHARRCLLAGRHCQGHRLETTNE